MINQMQHASLLGSLKLHFYFDNSTKRLVCREHFGTLLEGGAVLLTTIKPWLSVRNMGAGMLGEIMLLLERQQENNVTAAIFRHTELTSRETEVLSWIAKGKSNQDIAEILGLSFRTVKKHIEHIFNKPGMENCTAAVLRANDFL